MSRKWTNISFKFEDRNGTVKEASADPRTQIEVFREYICEEWDEEFLANAYSNIDLMFGHLSDAKLTTYMTQIFTELPFIQAAGIVYVSDSAWQGFGYYYERESADSVELQETYTEPEGCNGNAVAEDILSNHGISVDPTWAWD